MDRALSHCAIVPSKRAVLITYSFVSKSTPPRVFRCFEKKSVSIKYFICICETEPERVIYAGETGEEIRTEAERE